MGEKFQRERGPDQIRNQTHGQVSFIEAPNKTYKEYLQLHFISYIKIDRIPVFEASVRISNVVV